MPKQAGGGRGYREKSVPLGFLLENFRSPTWKREEGKKKLENGAERKDNLNREGGHLNNVDLPKLRFLPGKGVSCWKKIEKNNFPTPAKHSSYASAF